jgi:hypothetical protein
MLLTNAKVKWWFNPVFVPFFVIYVFFVDNLEMKILDTQFFKLWLWLLGKAIIVK